MVKNIFIFALSYFDATAGYAPACLDEFNIFYGL
jgi:hypothetical protein